MSSGIYKRIEKICKIEGCNNKHLAKGYCNKHYKQIQKYRKILERTRYDPNKVIDCGDYYEICIYSGRGEQTEVARAKIDKEDLKKVKKYRWYLDGHGYAITTKNKKTILLHQLILGKKEKKEIDHINHNILDNRKQKLRFVTRNQNQWNRKSIGAYWNKHNKIWQTVITKNNNRIHLGTFTNKQDAITARKQAEQKYFGEFAYQSNKLKIN